MTKYTMTAAFLCAVATATALGCGDLGADESTTEATAALSGTWMALRYTESDNRLWTGPYGDNFPNTDWAVGRRKAECGLSGGNQLTAMVGISDHFGPTSCSTLWGLFGCSTLQQNDVVLCSTSSMSIDQYFDSRLTASYGQNDQRDTTWGDWAYGYTKLECLPGQAVTGIAGRNVLCSRISNYKSPPTGCNTRYFFNQNSQPSTNRGDWAVGSFKGECRIGEYIKGVALQAEGNNAQGILCCTPGR